MKSKKLNILIIIGAALAVLGIIVWKFDIKELFQIIVASNKKWILLALLCMLCYSVFESGVLYCTANSIRRKLSFLKAFKTTMIGLLFNNLTPFQSGGQPMQLYYLTKESFMVGEASSILLMKFIVYQVSLIVYSIVLLFVRYRFFYEHSGKLAALIGVGFLVNIAVVIGLIMVGFLPGFTSRLVHGIIALLSKLHLIKNKEKAIENAKYQIESFHDGFRQLLKQKKVLLQSVVVSCAQLTAFFFIPFCICMALGVQVESILSMVAASAFVLMISSFVPLPGASGGAEGSFYLLFGIFILNPSIIAVALILWRLITYYLPIFVGIFFCGVKKVPAAKIQAE